jgi:DNA-directed RNA polymerase specialized sigma24 family protein
MLGSVSKAEDIVQEAFLRPHHTLQDESPYLGPVS